MAFRTEESGIFTALVRFLSIVLPDGCVANAQVASGAAIDADKLRHRFRGLFSQTGTAVAATQAMHVAAGTSGTIKAVKFGSIVANIGAATVTIDVKKNGTTILSASIVLDNANTARVVEAGTLSVTTVAAGDLIEAAVTVAAGGGTLATGLYGYVEIDEDAT